MTKKRRSEVVLGKPVIAWLEREGWDVYQEVQRHWGGACADIVATKGDVVAVVELKTALTFELLAQAHEWVLHGLAHHVFVAVPDARWSEGRRMAYKVFADHGIGMLQVFDGENFERYGATTADRVKEKIPPQLLDAANVAELRSVLRPEHKTHAPAGSAHGGHFTQFRQTCDRLRAFVQAKPGATLREAVAGIQHHYASASSARAQIKKLISKGVVNGLRAERDQSRKVRLYPNDTGQQRNAMMSSSS